MLTSPGLFGGYPAPSAYVHYVFGSDLFEQAAAGKAYPVGDVCDEEAALHAFSGEHQLEQDPYTMMIAVKTGDLYLSSGRAAAASATRCCGREERIEEDIAGGHLQRELGRARLRPRETAKACCTPRLDRARPASEWWAEQRQRILDQDLIETVKVMYAESMRLEPRWAAEFRGFWDLPEDFDFDVITPTVMVQRAEPGKVTPEDSVREYLAGSEIFLPEARRRRSRSPPRSPARRSPTCSTRSSAAAP